MITRLRRFISQPHLPAILFAAGCALTLALALVGTTTLLLAYIAVVVLGLLAATVALWLRMALILEENDLLGMPLALADDRQALDLHWSLAKSLQSISANHDPVYRDLALERTRQLDTEIGEIAHDRIVFTGTERWRMAYERLLQSRGLHLYRSVAVVRTAHYWQDEPGRQSMAVNFAAHKERFLNIERIAIVADSLWPVAERLPIEPLQTWLADQHTHGLSVRLVRLSELGREPDLVLDLGIYGTRAVGAKSRTTRAGPCDLRFHLTSPRSWPPSSGGSGFRSWPLPLNRYLTNRMGVHKISTGLHVELRIAQPPISGQRAAGPDVTQRPAYGTRLRSTRRRRNLNAVLQ